MRRHLFALAFVAVAASAGAAVAAPFERMVVVGDSLSDPGNIFALTSALPFIDPIPESPPYSNGLFSNGPIWTERLAARLGLDAGSVSNRALGGARTDGHVAFDDIPDFLADPLRDAGVGGIKQQADIYIASNGPVPANGLYVVWGGANDYLGGVVRTLPDGTPQPVANLKSTISDFADQGAVTFLVPNLPDLGAIPSTRGGAAAAELSARTEVHNDALGRMLDDLRQSRNLELVELDVASLFEAAASFGFANVTDPCIGRAQGCEGYLFFDGLHPTTTAHSILGDLAYQAVVVPVPAPIALFATGVLVLVGLRRSGHLRQAS